MFVLQKLLNKALFTSENIPKNLLDVLPMTQIVLRMALAVSVQISARISALYWCTEEIIDYPILSPEVLIIVPIVISSLVIFDSCVKSSLLEIKSSLRIHYRDKAMEKEKLGSGKIC